MMSEKAVIQFMQVKRRTRKAPVLIFVPNQQALAQIVDHIPEGARHLMNTFWPGPLTIQFDLHPDLPRKLRKNLNGFGKVGIRIPQCPVAQAIVQHFNEPILVSSANIERKKGAQSEAQIRKNFGRWINIMISNGDLRGEGSSTVLDVTQTPPEIKRQGSISDEDIFSTWNAPLTQTESGLLEAAVA
jgi:L-threonylcarbamoyladenylate synthase